MAVTRLRPKDLRQPPDDEEQWLLALLQEVDFGFAQIARNMIWHRLVYRHGATEPR